MQATHTAREGLEGRIRDLKAILALGEGHALLAQWAQDRLTDLGFDSSVPYDEWTDQAYAIAGSYVYGAHVLYRLDEDTPKVSRVELLLAGGGPTHVLTWDERGPGWGDYMDSWATPDTCTLTNEEDDVLTSFIERFIAPDGVV